MDFRGQKLVWILVYFAASGKGFFVLRNCFHRRKRSKKVFTIDLDRPLNRKTPLRLRLESVTLLAVWCVLPN